MKCRYSFAVKGYLRLGATFPISHHGRTYDFVKDADGMLTNITVEIEEPDRANWPTFTPTPQGPTTANIRFTQPQFDNISQVIMFLEGVLSFYGMQSIDTENFSVEWVPESDDERALLKVHGYSSAPALPKPGEIPETKLGLLAQSLYAYDTCWNLEPLFNFVRRGFLAIQDLRFIEAIYYYYFYLEGRYGNGKSRNKDVATEFRKSQDLMHAIEVARDQFDLRQNAHWRPIYARFDSTYRGRPAAEIALRLVELRGFLHHYSHQRPGTWHPSDKWTYAADAYLLGGVVVPLAREESVRHVFSSESRRQFAAAVRQHESQETGAV